MKNQTQNTAEVLLKRLAHVATHDVTAALSVSMPSVLCAAHAASLSSVMQCCLTHVSSGLSLLYTVNFSEVTICTNPYVFTEMSGLSKTKTLIFCYYHSVAYKDQTSISVNGVVLECLNLIFLLELLI